MNIQIEKIEQPNQQPVNEKGNIFNVPKDVFCLEHKNQKIEWLNLSKDCKTRLYCIKCERPQNQFILKYEQIFKKICFDCFNRAWFYGQELEKVKKALFSQFEQINQILQDMHNYYQHYLESTLDYCLIHPVADLSYQQLFDISEHLSSKIIFQNNSISFIPQVTTDDKKKIEKIKRCIQLYQNCVIKVQETIPFSKVQTVDLALCRSLEVQKEFQNVHYEIVLEKDLQWEISAIDLNWDSLQIVIACSKGDLNHEIQFWKIDEQEWKVMKFSERLLGHKSKIITFQRRQHHMVSVDISFKIIFWVMGLSHKWFLAREVQCEMNQISCIEFDTKDNHLAIGGKYVQLWKHLNSQEIDVINLQEQNISQDDVYITCLKFNHNRQKLVIGNTIGIIYIFEQVDLGWEQSQKLQSSEQSIRYIGFISENDFISISHGNQWTKWNFFPDTGYDSFFRIVDQLDNYMFVEEMAIMINPIEIFKDGNNENVELSIRSDLYSFQRGAGYLAVCSNNRIRIFALSLNQ